MSAVARSAGVLAAVSPAASWTVVVLVGSGFLLHLGSSARQRRIRADLIARAISAARLAPDRHDRRWSPLGALVDGWHGGAGTVGAGARRLLGRPPDPVAAERLGAALLVGLLALATGLGPVVAVVVGFGAWAGPLVRTVARRSRAKAALVDELPEVVDLVLLGIGSGLNVRLALEAVVRHHDGPIAADLREVLDRAERGERLADALDATLGASSTALAPLVDALVAAERYGAPLAASLDRVAGDARLSRRRQREEAARRVPVKLLFPLVFCTLPAFALLTVVPVLLRSLPSLAP